MRILQVITPSKVAGAERSTTSLCEHLVRAGHEVIVACKAGSELIPVMRDVGLDVRGVEMSGKLNFAAIPRLAQLARKERVDVIHTHLSTAAQWGCFTGQFLGIPAVAHVRALNQQHCYQLADRIIAVSQAVKDHLVAQGTDGHRIDVVYNGIDPERYYMPMPEAEAKARLGFTPEQVVFGIVGHLSARKGHTVFLDAFARIANDLPEAAALFVGEGVQREALEQQARDLGIASRVIFAGFQGDVLPYYAAMDVVVLPAVSIEGLGRVTLEGGLLGRPAIGSDMGGIPETIREGETGYVVPAGDALTLADRMGRLGGDADLRRRMGATARAWVGKTFTIEAMIAGTLATYRRAGVKGA